MSKSGASTIHAVDDILPSMGFFHQRGTGYKPELDPYQTYRRPTGDAGVPYALLGLRLGAVGFQRGVRLFQAGGNEWAMTYARTLGPYLEETLQVFGSATHAHRIVHQRAQAPRD